MSAQAQMRAMLDQLMGTSRDGECLFHSRQSETKPGIWFIPWLLTSTDSTRVCMLRYWVSRDLLDWCVKKSLFHMIHGSCDLDKSFDAIEIIGLIDRNHFRMIIPMFLWFLFDCHGFVNTVFVSRHYLLNLIKHHESYDLSNYFISLKLFDENRNCYDSWIINWGKSWLETWCHNFLFPYSTFFGCKNCNLINMMIHDIIIIFLSWLFIISVIPLLLFPLLLFLIFLDWEPLFSWFS